MTNFGGEKDKSQLPPLHAPGDRSWEPCGAGHPHTFHGSRKARKKAEKKVAKAAAKAAATDLTLEGDGDKKGKRKKKEEAEKKK